MAYENNAEPDNDVATRTGEFAMLIFSIGRLLISNLMFRKVIWFRSGCGRWILTPSPGSTGPSPNATKRRGRGRRSEPS